MQPGWYMHEKLATSVGTVIASKKGDPYLWSLPGGNLEERFSCNKADKCIKSLRLVWGQSIVIIHRYVEVCLTFSHHSIIFISFWINKSNIVKRMFIILWILFMKELSGTGNFRMIIFCIKRLSFNSILLFFIWPRRKKRPLTLCLSMSSADNLCKQCGPRSGGYGSP